MILQHFTFHLQYKYSGTFGPFANRKYGELSYPKNQKMCDPIISLRACSPIWASEAGLARTQERNLPT